MDLFIGFNRLSRNYQQFVHFQKYYFYTDIALGTVFKYLLTYLCHNVWLEFTAK